MGKWPRVLLLLLVLAGLGWALLYHWRTKNIGPVERGFRVALDSGCFACHGPGGLRGMANPGYGLDDVPSFSGGLLTMYADSEAEVREWILDGMPKRIRDDAEKRKLREKALIAMPAWRDRLSKRQIDDLVAFVLAVADFETPQDEQADLGRQTAKRLGCFNCHGPQGRGDTPNAGSFKGYIPAWDGADFPVLAQNDGEIREWILDGRSQRFQADRATRFFLDRQAVRMPAYRGHLSQAEVDGLVAYIHWLRQGRR